MAVAVEVGRCHTASLWALAPAARRRRPAVLEPQLPADEVVGGDRAVVAADDDVGDLVAVEVGDDAGRVDAALRRSPFPEQMPFRIEHEGRVERGDDLELPVAVQVDEAR